MHLRYCEWEEECHGEPDGVVEGEGDEGCLNREDVARDESVDEEGADQDEPRGGEEEAEVEGTVLIGRPNYVDLLSAQGGVHKIPVFNVTFILLSHCLHKVSEGFFPRVHFYDLHTVHYFAHDPEQKA